jgi:plasmid stability protein
MANLTIKNVPERLVRRLKAQAVRHHRSLNLEVISCLEAVTQTVPLDPEALLARARTIRRAPARMDLNDQTLAALKAQGRA